MKKNLIWMLTAIMAVTFCTLLYFQIMYLENMVKMRNEQFSEEVMRSLYATSEFLEKRETLHFLEEDINIIESGFYDYDNNGQGISPASETNFNSSADPKAYEPLADLTEFTYPAEPLQNVSQRYGTLREAIRTQYLYQRGLLSEVILTILRDAGSRPVTDRADSTAIRNSLSAELHYNGVNLPFNFAVYNNRQHEVYCTGDFSADNESSLYSITLFANTGNPCRLTVEFPTKGRFIFSSVRFIIPTLALTVVLLVIFIYTVMLVFRQKNISEMKTDFVNNMTHELKTPVSTISLAGQMLSDPSVTKSPATIAHLAEVIVEESKRLRFQVEKVLHLSVVENEGATLNFTTVNADRIIRNVVNTFKLKVEKQGGTLCTNLEAERAEVCVDEMQFTNVIFNLLDNALKYMRADTPPDLMISTRDVSGNKLEIRVKDNGIGIRKDDIKKIFEKFYRVNTGNRHDVKGFGLGLAYVKKMIEAFHGSISVESVIDQGSEFIILLPLSEEQD